MKNVKIFIPIAILICIITALCININAATYSGYCGGEGDGSNLSWMLNTYTGELVISGDGDMRDYSLSSSNLAPWYNYRSYIRTVILDNNVTSIGDYSFISCDGLMSVVMPRNLITIGTGVFMDCYSLSSIEIPASVTGIGDRAFHCCEGLDSITVNAANTNYSSDEYGVLFDKEKITLIQYPTGNSHAEYVVPSSVNQIEPRAFYSCDPLVCVELPASVTCIGDSAFAFCESLASIELSSNLTTVGYDAFYGCYSLTCIELPASLTTIGERAFSDCGNLKKATVYTRTVALGSNVFKYPHADFEIHGYAGSTAETYANEYNHPFVVLCEHPEYVFNDELSIYPTCLEGGVYVYVCTGCGHTAQQDVSPLGHTMGDWEVTIQPDETMDGEERRDCMGAGCDYYETRQIPTKNAAVITVSSDRVIAGGRAKIDVAIRNNSGFGGIELSVKFDNSVLTLESIDTSSAIINSTITPLDVANDTGEIIFCIAGLSNVAGDGNFATLVFEIAEDAAVGTLPLTVEYDEENSFYYCGQNMLYLPLAKEDGEIQVIDWLYGDADGSGEVTIRDATLILQYLVGWDVIINLGAADAYGDGRIDIRDAAHILQYLANWDVTLG